MIKNIFTAAYFFFSFTFIFGKVILGLAEEVCFDF